MKTVGITESTHKRLKKIAKSNSMDMGEFITEAVNYFNMTGADPSDEKQSPKKAIEENNKRLNQVIAFIRKQESDHMLPILKKMMENNSILNDYVTKLKPETFKTAYEESANNLQTLQEHILQLELQMELQSKKLEGYSKLLAIMIKIVSYEKGLLGGDKQEREELKELLKSYVH